MHSLCPSRVGVQSSRHCSRTRSNLVEAKWYLSYNCARSTDVWGTHRWITLAWRGTYSSCDQDHGIWTNLIVVFGVHHFSVLTSDQTSLPVTSTAWFLGVRLITSRSRPPCVLLTELMTQRSSRSELSFRAQKIDYTPLPSSPPPEPWDTSWSSRYCEHEGEGDMNSSYFYWTLNCRTLGTNQKCHDALY